MKLIFKSLLAMGLLAGCAQDALRDAEFKARNPSAELNLKALTQYRDVKALGDYAQRLAVSYGDAADNIQRFQDLSSLLVIVAAGRAVDLLAAGASDEVVGRAALGGAVAQTLGVRFAPKIAILGVLTGAKRLNCIALHAGILDAELNGATLAGATEATRAAVLQVQLLTREALVREQANFDALFEQFRNSSDVGALRTETRATRLEQYQQKLSTCVDDTDKPESNS